MTPRRFASPVALALIVSASGLATPSETRAAPVVIQELLYDGSGTDAPEAFTELFGEPGMMLDGWLLVGINGSTGTAYRQVDLTGAVIPTDGVLVVATSSAEPGLAAVRDVVASVDWQNGPDAVQLLDPAGTIVDAIQYGDAAENNAGFGLPAPDTPGGFQPVPRRPGHQHLQQPGGLHHRPPHARVRTGARPRGAPARSRARSGTVGSGALGARADRHGGPVGVRPTARVPAGHHQTLSSVVAVTGERSVGGRSPSIQHRYIEIAIIAT